MFNMNDIYARLANGEKIEDIGNEIANMMNEAVAKHEADVRAAEEAKRAEADKEASKRELVKELVENIKKLAVLEGMDPDELTISDDEIDQMVAAFTDMFAAMRDIKHALADLEARAPKVHNPTDEQILADFLKMFN